jgi:hypothetical protein
MQSANYGFFCFPILLSMDWFELLIMLVARFIACCAASFAAFAAWVPTPPTTSCLLAISASENFVMLDFMLDFLSCSFSFCIFMVLVWFGLFCFLVCSHSTAEIFTMKCFLALIEKCVRSGSRFHVDVGGGEAAYGSGVVNPPNKYGAEDKGCFHRYLEG